MLIPKPYIFYQHCADQHPSLAIQHHNCHRVLNPYDIEQSKILQKNNIHKQINSNKKKKIKKMLTSFSFNSMLSTKKGKPWSSKKPIGQRILIPDTGKQSNQFPQLKSASEKGFDNFLFNSNQCYLMTKESHLIKKRAKENQIHKIESDRKNAS